MDKSSTTQTVSPPVAPVDRWLAPVQRFLHVEASSGIVLLTCTAVALGLANSPAAAWFASLWKTAVSVSVGGFTIAGDVGHLVINDGLMTIFFLVVGLEIKRHMVHGELRDPRKALLPMFAALGGVALPAAIYLAFQWGEPGQRGWAVPMATDIAFVVGFLALFGSRVPFGLKILLLSLAIVDDLIAVLIIAFVFTETIAWIWLMFAGVAFGVIYLFQRIGVRAISVYVPVGAFIWFAFLQAGVHPTVAGVMLGLLTPARAWLGEVSSPLQRLEDGLHPWVAFGIMPLFALANAGVRLEASALAEPVAMAVAVSLAIGKPVGILLLCLLAVRSGLTSLPDGVTWPMLAGGACLAGIGFTMALFLNSLAFPGAAFAEAATAGKIGTLAGSVVSAVIGAVVLSSALKR
jgi:NhaA family Na+:H+ antiporter